MKRIDSTNILLLGQEYFSSIGLSTKARSFFTSKNFESAAVIILPEVCIIRDNRPPGSSSGQTHIHVTGDVRFAFYDRTVIEKTTKTSGDDIRKVVVSKSNIENLRNRTSSFSDMDNVESSTISKLSVHSKNDVQVQLSKIRKDGNDFLNLRRGLYLNDLLVFLKYRGQNRFFAFGIHKEFFENEYMIANGFLTDLTSPGTVTVGSVIKELADTNDTSATLPASNDLDDMIYQQLVDEADADNSYDSDYRPELYDGSVSGSGKSGRPATSASLGKAAIKHNGYRCIFNTGDDKHSTFLKPNNLPYMEVHHLIPLSEQWRFANKLDTKANLIPLCPLCHRKLHHGRQADIANMLHELFLLYYDALDKSGLLVMKDGTVLTEDILISFY